ncbi:MAG: NAD(+) diphosphatase [Polyangiaceae bacterium]
MEFVAGLVAPEDTGQAYWFAFRGDELLVRVEGSEVSSRSVGAPCSVPRGARPAGALDALVLGQLGGHPCFATRSRTERPEGHDFATLRALFTRLDPVLYPVAGLAYQLVHFERRYRHCPQCTAPLEAKLGERARRCPRCAIDIFPPVSPATITLIHDGPRVLMTRQAHFPPGMYGLVAGFLEPGETLEACVAREVMEETALEIANLRYFGSQPWPFPHQVMVGFTARLAGGELRVDPRELEEARWFHREEMPRLPPRISIARALIDAWLAEPVGG